MLADLCFQVDSLRFVCVSAEADFTNGFVRFRSMLEVGPVDPGRTRRMYHRLLCWCVEMLADIGLEPKSLAHGKGHPKTCGGVAGATQVLTLVDLPTCIAGHCGISRWDVMCDRGSSSDPIGSRVLVRMPGRGRDFVSQGVIRFEKLQDDETTIMRLPSGHCSEKLMKFPRTGCHPPSTSNTELGGHPFTMRLLGET